MEEIRIVSIWNENRLKEIEKALLIETESKMNREVEEDKIFTNMMNLFTKSKQQQEKLLDISVKSDYYTDLKLKSVINTNINVDIIHLTLMKADWLSKWALNSYRNVKLRTGGVDEVWVERRQSALNAYEEAVRNAEGLGLRGRGVSGLGLGGSGSGSGSGSGLESGSLSLSLRSEAYGKLSRYCDELLRLRDKDDDNDSDGDGEGMNQQLVTVTSNQDKEDTEQLVLQTVTAYLKGLQLHNTFCREHVVRILSLASRTHVATQEFLRLWPNIPAWTFLRFSAQLMGSLDLKEGPLAAAVLERVASLYPKALYHSYCITKEFLGEKGKELCAKGSFYVLQATSLGSTTINTVKGDKIKTSQNKSQISGSLITHQNQNTQQRSCLTLDKLLCDHDLDCFVEALGGLTHPELRWDDAMKAMKSLGKDLPKASNICKLMFTNVLQTTWGKVGNKIGTYNKKCAKDWYKDAVAIAGMNGEKLMNVKSFEAFIDLDRKSDVMKFTSGKVLKCVKCC